MPAPSKEGFEGPGIRNFNYASGAPAPAVLAGSTPCEERTPFFGEGGYEPFRRLQNVQLREDMHRGGDEQGTQRRRTAPPFEDVL
jgi:hypothetical protein